MATKPDKAYYKVTLDDFKRCYNIMVRYKLYSGYLVVLDGILTFAVGNIIDDEGVGGMPITREQLKFYIDDWDK